jgi:hypothetical protein
MIQVFQAFQMYVVIVYLDIAKVDREMLHMLQVFQGMLQAFV